MMHKIWLIVAYLLSYILVDIDFWYSPKRKTDQMSGPLCPGLFWDLCMPVDEFSINYSKWILWVNPSLYRYDKLSKDILSKRFSFLSKKLLVHHVIYQPIGFHWLVRKRHLLVMTCKSCNLLDNVPILPDSSFPNHMWAKLKLTLHSKFHLETQTYSANLKICYFRSASGHWYLPCSNHKEFFSNANFQCNWFLRTDIQQC